MVEATYWEKVAVLGSVFVLFSAAAVCGGAVVMWQKADKGDLYPSRYYKRKAVSLFPLGLVLLVGCVFLFPMGRC